MLSRVPFEAGIHPDFSLIGNLRSQDLHCSIETASTARSKSCSNCDWRRVQNEAEPPTHFASVPAMSLSIATLPDKSPWTTDASQPMHSASMSGVILRLSKSEERVSPGFENQLGSNARSATTCLQCDNPQPGYFGQISRAVFHDRNLDVTRAKYQFVSAFETQRPFTW